MRSPTRRAATAAFALALASTSCAGATNNLATAAAEPASATAVETAVEAPPTSPPVQIAPADAATSSDSEPRETAQPQETPVPPPAVEPEPVAPEPVANQLPDVSVVDLSNGETTALTGFTRPGPTLVWFWAPH